MNKQRLNQLGDFAVKHHAALHLVKLNLPDHFVKKHLDLINTWQTNKASHHEPIEYGLTTFDYKYDELENNYAFALFRIPPHQEKQTADSTTPFNTLSETQIIYQLDNLLASDSPTLGEDKLLQALYDENVEFSLDLLPIDLADNYQKANIFDMDEVINQIKQTIQDYLPTEIYNYPLKVIHNVEQDKYYTHIDQR